MSEPPCENVRANSLTEVALTTPLSATNASLRNNLVDGWRGISVLCVVVGHYLTYQFPPIGVRSLRAVLQDAALPELAQNLLYRILVPIGETGVLFFFVISGYLITKLLASEEQRNGRVSLSAFYIRRTFRILPAFYVYLLALLALSSAGLIRLDSTAFVRSAAYVCNVSMFRCSWWLGHTWSLSVEEQFYLAWPLIFIWVGFRRAKVALAFLAFLVLTSYFYYEFSGFAHIAAGAFVALSKKARLAIDRLSTPLAISVAVAFLVFQPLLEQAQLIDAYMIARSLNPLVTTFVLFGTINDRGPLVWLVSNPLIQKVGLVSYSVYLWQQLSTAPVFWGGSDTGANVLYSSYPSFIWLFPIPAILSYIFIERPMIAGGRKLSDWATRIARCRQRSGDRPTDK